VRSANAAAPPNMEAAELRQRFTFANAFKEGDLAVGGTTDDRLRHEARRALLATTVGEIRRSPLVADGVTAALERTRDRRFDGDLDPLTMARVKDALLGPGAAAWASRYRDALSSEAIAGAAKVMTDGELSAVARALFNPLDSAGISIGSSHHFGSRIQPNSPGDDEQEILFSILEGLSFGCGDVIVGLNPAADDVETIVRLERLLAQVVERLELPTRFCVLSDIVKQAAARQHARIDVAFQSLAGTSRALAGMVGLDVDGLLDLARGFDRLYFETGQGSEVTNGNAEGVDMVTLEARTYGVARHLVHAIGESRAGVRPWTIVNDVAGFIGPEVFRTADQLERACLEDAVMAKLHGLAMGLDVCATFHMGIAPAALRRLTERIVDRAAPAYVMAVAGNADPMLGYLTTSFREHPRLRSQARRRMTSRMEERLTELGVLTADGAPRPGVDTVARLYAIQTVKGGDTRASSTLEDEGRRRVRELRARGFDVGGVDQQEADGRVEALYAHARRALYARIDDHVIRDASPVNMRVRTSAADRDDYLAHPAAGERLRDDDAREAARHARGRAPHVQIVISDGLNADAVNEQLRALLPPLRRLLAEQGTAAGETDIVVENGRVRAGYHIGELTDAAIVIHVVGERPGTGLNTVSAYLTYGRDETGRSRWKRDLDHSATTAICGIHPRGKAPQVAAAEIARTVARMVEQRRSGVALSSASSRV
jgi:ethanolamine ammonia-lyase large subunit